jgi:hypothetical protein
MRLAHRQSFDFDFFSARPFRPLELFRSVPYLHDQRITQQAENTLGCDVETESGPVRVAFFGGLTIGPRWGSQRLPAFSRLEPGPTGGWCYLATRATPCRKGFRARDDSTGDALHERTPLASSDRRTLKSFLVTNLRADFAQLRVRAAPSLRDDRRVIGELKGSRMKDPRLEEHFRVVDRHFV